MWASTNTMKTMPLTAISIFSAMVERAPRAPLTRSVEGTSLPRTARYRSDAARLTTGECEIAPVTGRSPERSGRVRRRAWRTVERRRSAARPARRRRPASPGVRRARGRGSPSKARCRSPATAATARREAVRVGRVVEQAGLQRPHDVGCAAGAGRDDGYAAGARPRAGRGSRSRRSPGCTSTSRAAIARVRSPVSSGAGELGVRQPSREPRPLRAVADQHRPDAGHVGRARRARGRRAAGAGCRRTRRRRAGPCFDCALAQLSCSHGSRSCGPNARGVDAGRPQGGLDARGRRAARRIQPAVTSTRSERSATLARQWSAARWETGVCCTVSVGRPSRRACLSALRPTVSGRGRRAPGRAERLERRPHLGADELARLDPGHPAAPVRSSRPGAGATTSTSWPVSTSRSTTALTVVVVPSTAGKKDSATRAIRMAPR